MRLVKKAFKKLHPILKPLYQWYLSKPRYYRYKGVRVKVYPGVFHPGLFFSTKVLLEFLSGMEIKGKRILELGAGSGLISIQCAKRMAIVTSSDINKVALKGLRENSSSNEVKISIVESDLFDNLNAQDFDIIIINPPYYPKAVTSSNDYAWYCGEKFEYFTRLFRDLAHSGGADQNVIMILSDDCRIPEIAALAQDNGLHLTSIFRKVVVGEESVVYRIGRITDDNQKNFDTGVKA